MKRLFLMLLIFTSALLAEIPWANSFDEAVRLSKSENKPIMLMFSSKTCPMCNYMKDVVYEDERVIEYVEHFFIPVEIDVHEHPNKYGYKVFGTPTYYFIDPDGKEMGRPLIGGAKAPAFLDTLKAVRGSK